MADEAVAEATKNYPYYRSHKVVQAAQIADVGDALNAAGDRVIYFVDPDYLPIACGGAMFARYIPVLGDYLVIYRDDYKSISPKTEFEDGYTKI